VEPEAFGEELNASHAPFGRGTAQENGLTGSDGNSFI
jgi:hypothetical protein